MRPGRRSLRIEHFGSFLECSRKGFAMQGFGPFELQLDRQRLLRAGEPVALGGRAFDLLVALWQRRDRVVEKAELIDLVWPCVVVEENNLQVQIGRLRKLLGADAIATVPGRGYRFTGVAGSGTPANGSATSARSSPPMPLQRLHGRDASLAALTGQFAQHPLVTIVGAGGIGKTLLARHWVEAHRPDHFQGATWIELADAVSPGPVASAVARALGVEAGSGDPLAGLCTALAPRQVLVAIDNAEHRVEEVAAVAHAILGTAPEVRLLVTSQTPLMLSQECVHRLGPLALPDGPLPAPQALGYGAVALFDERARSVDNDFVLTDELVGEVIGLCRQLDGSPLAIELLAGRVPLLGVHRLAGLLNDPLRLLNSNRKRDAPARQQTLRAGLQRSHDLLEAREQVVFRRLAVFAEGAPLDAIQRVVADAEGPIDGWATIDALGLLVDRSLVVLSTADDEAVPHYRLLHATRAYALERLAQAGEDEAVTWRHALWRGARFGSGDEGQPEAGERTVESRRGDRAGLPPIPTDGAGQ